VALWGVSLEIDCVADPQLRAMVPNVKVVGRALTLKLVGADAVAVNRALAQIRPGDVLLIDTGGDNRHAPVGAVTSCAARCARAGAVIGQALASDQAEPRLLERLRTGEPVAQVLRV
jgi:regulator of RNase E activity RraA